MLVDPNKIAAAVKRLDDAMRDLSANLNYAVSLTIQDLNRCLNEGYGDRSEPTTYADMLASARSWAQDRIAELEESDDGDREDIVDRAVKMVAVRVHRNQALIEVFMSKPELVNVDCDDEFWNPTPSQVMWHAIRVTLIEDMQDLIDGEDNEHGTL